LPDFLIPWEPVFKGPLPLALSSSSFFALASERFYHRLAYCPNNRNTEDNSAKHTGLLLLLERQIILIEVLLRLLRSLQGLDLAT